MMTTSPSMISDTTAGALMAKCRSRTAILHAWPFLIRRPRARALARPRSLPPPEDIVRMLEKEEGEDGPPPRPQDGQSDGARPTHRLGRGHGVPFSPGQRSRSSPSVA